MKKAAFIVVAIDGGAASGKSSTSKILSDRLGLLYVNTGSHYRALTWAILERGISADRVDKIKAFLESLEVDNKIEGSEAHMTLGGYIPGRKSDLPGSIEPLPNTQPFRKSESFYCPGSDPTWHWPGNDPSMG